MSPFPHNTWAFLETHLGCRFPASYFAAPGNAGPRDRLHPCGS